MSRKPNILILFTDMQRADTVHALGNDVIKTPQLDRLAREGTAFTNCFSPSPVCVPARCCMHYGLYPQKTGLFQNGVMMEDNGLSYPAVLGRHGYRAHAVGKCHFTPDALALRGFQTRRTQEECVSDAGADDYIAWLSGQGYDYYEAHGARGEMYYIPQISALPARAHPSQWIGDESIRFIRAASGRKDTPWCLFASFIHPHPPFAPPKPWHKLYRAPNMPPPFIPEEGSFWLTWINRLQNRYKYRDRGLDINLLRVIKAYYYAAISFVDYQIGRILQTLEETGGLDDTLVLFTSDHGEYLGDFGCFGKRGMHDASVRVPMLLRFPSRFPAGLRCSAAVTLCDVFPTLLGAAGITRDGLELDGLDLAGIALGENRSRIVYSQFSQGEKAIYMAVNEQWKYVYSAGDGAEFFFDRLRGPSDAEKPAPAAQTSDQKLLLKEALLKHLQSAGRKEAYAAMDNGLEWRAYPRIDETYLRDPDAGLIVQDYPSYPLDLPGYWPEEPDRPDGAKKA